MPALVHGTGARYVGHIVTSPREARFLSVRSLRVRWDCGRTTVYAHLAIMRKLGIYSGFRLGTDQRVALSAVERYEAHLAKETVDLDRGRIAALRAASSGQPPTSNAPDRRDPVEADAPPTSAPASLRASLRAMYRSARTKRPPKR